MRKKSAILLSLLTLPALFAGEGEWVTEGFEGFKRGSFGNGGDNIYVSAAGILQRIRQSDINGDGYMDLLICNSQEHEEYVMPTSYFDILRDPSKQTSLRIGGAGWDIAVADLNKDGYEDVVIPANWNGSSWVPNSIVYYGSEKGITNHYIHALPVSGGRAEVGDFNGDSWKDIVFVSGSIDKFTIKYLPNSVKGFLEYTEHVLEFPELKQANGVINALCSVMDGKSSVLLLRLTNGAVYGLKFCGDLPEKKLQLLLAAEPGFKKERSRWADANQYVPEPEPKLKVLKIKGVEYVFAAYTKNAALYPFINGKFDLKKAIRFDVPRAFSITAGDVRKKGFDDIVIAARAEHDGKECCFYYPAVSEGVWRDADRVPIYSIRITDAIIADFGGKELSLALFESNTDTSYVGKVLLFKEFKGAESLTVPPMILPNADARIALAPRMKDRQHLLVANTRYGNATSKLPVYIYPGSSKGFNVANQIRVAANGAMDGFFADLNDDGKPDLILANEVEMAPHLNDGNYVYYNIGGKFSTMPDLKLPSERATGVTVADFDRNGYLDMVFTALDEAALTIYYGEKNNQYRKEKIKLEDGFLTLWLASADVNMDGFIDLVVPNCRKNGGSCVLYGSPKGFDCKNRFDFQVTKSQTCRVADVNHDGYPDVIWAGYYPTIGKPLDSFVSIYYGSKKGFDNSRRTMIPCNDSNTLAVADFNNDGLLDLFVGAYDNRYSREIDSHIYWNDAKNGFTEDNRTYIRTEASCGAIVGDFNNDGWKDLALANHKIKTQHNSYSQVWYNDQGRFSPENTVKLPSKGPHGMISAPMSNGIDRSASEFYTSSVFKPGKTFGMIQASAKMCVPRTCQVKITLRSAETAEGLNGKEWKEISFGQEINAKDFPGKYFQYRLELIAPDGIGTPRISQIKILFK